jgi:hypothetical protein
VQVLNVAWKATLLNALLGETEALVIVRISPFAYAAAGVQRKAASPVASSTRLRTVR